MKLNNIIFDKILSGVILNKDTKVVERYLSQLQNLSLEVSADPVEITDKDGVVVYRKYTAKNLNVSATNAFISTDVIAMTSGSEAEATEENADIVFPAVDTVDVAEKEYTVKKAQVASIKLCGLSKSGAIVKTYVLTTDYQLDKTGEDNEFEDEVKITLPVDAGEGVQKYLVTYQRKAADGMKIDNKSSDFPKTTELLFKALAVDPCDQNHLKACYIDIPSFMADPSVTIEINNTDASTIDFTGTAMLDMCAGDSVLFTIMFVDEDAE